MATPEDDLARALAQLPVIPKGKPLSVAERGDLLAAVLPVYRAGATFRQIAAQTHRSYGSISRLLNEEPDCVRGRGGDTRRPASRRST
ncbi:helix-turn-helix domain-containing protein [Streptomyces cyaneofuscatus]|uniref:helix-turn-helix domain-containing protein n=1 Tax=Streptomyces TaxID=1883 RepID=UPI002241BB92|nr:helix-turn-helix domain-containing protein [Streptomyces sp. VB1]UZI27972.1 helix-turn-helix domain-containing protein [Streptomyces sp. VB1]